ncbi:MAG: dTMP kinase [Verrucomicrobiota bacterium]|jgi:dTMP kinase|nr:dTMP kinase [Verrucomicrobiota bacterium]
MSGLLITFEGIEGCGKSTQIERLAKQLPKVGRQVVTLREPGGTPIGEAIREVVKHPPGDATISPDAELLLMNASRAQLVQEAIRPALAKGAVVLCDRFYDSSLAYQGFGRELDMAKVQQAIDLAVGDTKPNLTLLLDIPLSVSQDRVSARHELTAELQDQFDESGANFFKRVLDGFHTLAKAEPDRFQIINGDQSLNNVTEEIWGSIQSHL